MWDYSFVTKSDSSISTSGVTDDPIETFSHWRNSDDVSEVVGINNEVPFEDEMHNSRIDTDPVTTNYTSDLMEEYQKAKSIR